MPEVTCRTCPHRLRNIAEINRMSVGMGMGGDDLLDDSEIDEFGTDCPDPDDDDLAYDVEPEELDTIPDWCPMRGHGSQWPMPIR